MKFKIFSDNAKSFTFKHEFETMDHAKLATTAILGYMIGTFEQPTAETTLVKNESNGVYTLFVKYVADKSLAKGLNRICDRYENHSKSYVEEA